MGNKRIKEYLLVKMSLVLEKRSEAKNKHGKVKTQMRK